MGPPILGYPGPPVPQKAYERRGFILFYFSRSKVELGQNLCNSADLRVVLREYQPSPTRGDPYILFLFICTKNECHVILLTWVLIHEWTYLQPPFLHPSKWTLYLRVIPWDLFGQGNSKNSCPGKFGEFECCRQARIINSSFLICVYRGIASDIENENGISNGNLFFFLVRMNFSCFVLIF